MELKINREFLGRHLFAMLVLAGMGMWFGYDGYVRYPSMTPAELYADAHKGAEPPDEAAAQKFYETAIPRQKQLMGLLLLAAIAVGAHLLLVSRTKMSFDDSGFTWRGKRYFYSEIRKVDRRKWAKKGILKLSLDNTVITLDSWHHLGVGEFEKKLGTAS